MICVRCASTTSADPCSHCGRSPLLDGRYRLDALLGRGRRGPTWRATQVAGERAVAIKAVRLDPTRPEADRVWRVRRLDAVARHAHRGIAPCLDHFVGGSVRWPTLYVVEAFVEGRTLAAEMAERVHGEEQVLLIIAEVARTLAALHVSRPCFVYGLIAPHRIVRRARDRALVLVGAGAVDEVMTGDAGADRPIGLALDAVAPEVHRGEACPASDLYGLGLTASALLARPPVDAEPDGARRVDWRRRVHPETVAVLDGLLAPDLAERFDDARRVTEWAEYAISAIARDRRAAWPAAGASSTAPPADRPRRGAWAFALALGLLMLALFGVLQGEARSAPATGMLCRPEPVCRLVGGRDRPPPIVSSGDSLHRPTSQGHRSPSRHPGVTEEPR